MLSNKIVSNVRHNNILSCLTKDCWTILSIYYSLHVMRPNCITTCALIINIEILSPTALKPGYLIIKFTY